MGADKAKAEKEVGRLRGELEAAIAKVSGEEKRRGGEGIRLSMSMCMIV
jgi:hypothetical protein